MDDSYPAIAMPVAPKTGGFAAKAAAPERAATFLARGTIEVKSADAIKFRQGNVEVFTDPEIGLFPTCGGTPPVGKATDVAKKLNVTALKTKRLTGLGVAIAVVDTGIDMAHLRSLGIRARLDKSITIAPPGVPSTPGSYPVDHGTMCAYDVLIAAPRATLVDIPTLLSTTPGGSAMAGFLSDALRAFSYLLNQINSPGWKYKALVVNNSWGMFHPSWDFPPGHPGRYADNPNHPFNIITGTLAAAGADILFAAGNCGADCPDGRCQGVVTKTITGANAHPSVLTLAGCDVNDLRVGYSSQGPGIPGMTKQKPDVTAYTHFLGSKAFGNTVPDSGTSAACPVAAGCVAALRTKRPMSSTTPTQIFDALRTSAKLAPAGGTVWNRDYGFGIIDPVAAAVNLGL